MPVAVSQIDDDHVSTPSPPPPPERSKALYDAVSKTFDIGDYNTFKEKMQSPESRKKFYDVVSTKFDIGTPEEFEKKIAPAPKTTVQDIRNANAANTDKTVQTGFMDVKESAVHPEVTQAKQDEADKKLLDVSAQWNQDPRNVSKVINDFPWETDDTKLQSHAQMLKDNPLAYTRLKASDENVNGLIGKVSKEDAHQYNMLQDAQDVNQLELNIAAQKAIINKDLVGADRARALKNLEISRAPFFNAIDPGMQPPEQGTKNDLAGVLDPYQYAGLRHLQNFDPSKFDLYSNMLKAKLGPSASVEQKIGLEKVKQELLNIGRKNTIDYIQEHQPILVNDWKNATDPAVKNQIENHIVANQKSLEYTASDEESDKAKFPYLADLEFERQAKELYGKPDQGVLSYALGKLGKSIGKAVGSVTGVVSDLAGGEEQRLNQLQSLGESEKDQNESYLPEKYKAAGSPFTYQFDQHLQDAVDQIKKDPAMSDEDKIKGITQLIKNNPSAVKTVTNPDAGKTANFFSKATVYRNAGMIGDLAGIAIQQAGMEGAGLPKLISAAMPMYLSSRDDYYKEALQEGNPHPAQYAELHAGIMMAAGMVNPDFNIAKRTLGINTAVGKAIADGEITEALWNKIVNSDKPMLARIKNAAIGATKEGLKLGAVYGAGTDLANNLANKGMFGSQMTGGEILEHAAGAAKDMTLSSIGLLGIHGLMNLKSASPQEKAAVWDLGYNSKLATEKIDNLVDAGKLTTEVGDQRKQIIKNIAKLIDRVPSKDIKGNPIPDEKRADMLYNLVAKEKIGQLKQDLPEAQGEHLQGVADGIDIENGTIIDPKSAKAAVIKELSSVKFPKMSPWAAQEGNGQALLKAIQQHATGYDFATGKVDEPDIGSLATHVQGHLIDHAIRALPDDIKQKISDAYESHGIKVPRQITDALHLPKVAEPKEPIPVSENISHQPSYEISRHSDTIKDEQGKVSGPNQHPLSPDGKSDAKDLGQQVLDRIKETGVQITKIIHSGLKRTAETAKAVSDKIGKVKMVADKGLNTWDIGDFDDVSDSEFKKVQKWFVEHPDEKKYGGEGEHNGKKLGESFNDYVNRTIKAHLKYENEPSSTMMIDHSNNMMVMDAYRKNGGVWDDKAAKDYLQSEKPEPATLQEKGPKTLTGVETKSATSEEPELPAGRTPVTPSGMTEEERQEAISARRSKTGLTKDEQWQNDFVGRLEKAWTSMKPSEKAQEIRNLKQEMLKKNAEAGYEKYRFDGAALKKSTKLKDGIMRYRKVTSRFKETGNTSILDNGRTLRDRSPELQNSFDDLSDVAHNLEILDASGKKRMSATQIKAAVDDVNDGIPSKRAESLLDTLEQAVKDDRFPIGNRMSISFSELTGGESEVSGEPLSEDNVTKWLDGESNLTPEQEEVLSDNIENFINDYSTEAGTEAQITEPEPTAKEGSVSPAEPRISDQAEEEAAQKVKELNEQRENEIAAEKKPEIPKLLSEREYAKLPAEEQFKHDDIEQKYKEFKNVIDCLFK